MDIFALLIEDHEKAKAIFTAIKETSEKQVKERERLFAVINLELSVHMEAEEKFFYPEILLEKKTHDKSMEAFEEHKVAKALLKELEADPKDTEQWAAKLKVLSENIEHHVKEEEEDIFPKARKLLSATEAQNIADEVLEYKETFNLVDQ
ncbi:MAG: hemerythrin domain-containing protein [Fibrobacterota bacterium]|nr:hemerythrin domain-containing protein [Fibrobacterota bacterium]